MKKYIFSISENMKKYIFILIASVMATAAGAQTMTPQEEREFFQKAYDVIVEYAKSAPQNDDQQKYKFTRLFENQEVKISNDLMVLNDKPVLPLWKYMQELRKADQVEVQVMNLRKGKVEDADSVWKMEVKFDKRISFLDNCFSFFDSNEVFGEPFHLKATLALDKETGKCSISDIATDGNWPKFPKDYRILQKRENDKRDNNLDVNGRRAVFNIYDQVFLRSEDKVTYNRGAVDEIDLGEDCGTKIEVDYKDKAWRVRANAGYALSEFNKLDGGKDSGITASDSHEMSFGVDFGYVFKTASKLKPGIFAGLGISSNGLTLETSGGEDSFNTSEDEDGDDYERHYKLWGSQGIQQKLKATDITVPIYLDLEYQITSLYSVYADLGVKLQTSSGKWTAEIDKYETWGVYHQSKYGNDLTIRNYYEEGHKINDVDLNGFGMHNESGLKDITIDESGTTKSMTINGLAGMGIRLNPTKSFAIDAGIQYLTGGKSWKSENGNLFSFTLPDNDKVNLLHKAKGIKQGSMRLTIGLIYKF